MVIALGLWARDSCIRGYLVSLASDQAQIEGPSDDVLRGIKAKVESRSP